MANLPALDIGYVTALSEVCEPKVRCAPKHPRLCCVTLLLKIRLNLWQLFVKLV